MPEEFSEGGYIEQCGGDTVDLREWWEQFNDPLLASLIDRSISCNLDLRIAREKICEARAIFGLQFSELLPHVNAVAAFNRMRNSQRLDDSPSLGGTFVNVYRAGFDTNWEIDLFGKLRDRARAALYDVVAQEEEVRNVHLSIASEVAKTYFLIRNLQERVKITKSHIVSETNLYETVLDQYKGGIVSEINVLTAKTLLDTRLAILPVQEEELMRAIYSMAILLTEIPENLTSLFSEFKEVPCTSGKIPLGLPSELLCRRGDVRSAELKMKASGARVLAERKELFPTISLEGFFQMATGMFTQWAKKGSQTWSFTPFVSLPLFRGGEIISKIRIETSLQYQAVMDYEKSVIIALQEMEIALNAYIQEAQAFYALEEKVKDSSEARELAQVLYLGGMVDFLYVLDTERDLYLAEIALSESKEQLATNLVAIYKALGGGWECSSTP
ncbi:MAG: Toluene efflux pump outer membrane protein TtgI [Chlamydiales bacterium]|nr:Toluene efflux pump outer membrane protein TtgI [Chlamydiales bacterium]MCH9619712.1 Toluene efflux pump outer membrane protein TtgI [Chlamydiales bacterium]MCH9623318.1 Toluene efflux pump outer membrane protein TtgI [Chlamydiales bacterium]